jgi:hypothetical protein
MGRTSIFELDVDTLFAKATAGAGLFLSAAAYRIAPR